MAQSLYSGDCSTVAEAIERFTTEAGLLVLRPGRGCFPWFTVPSGCYALVTRHGADLDYEDKAVWPAGLHLGYPPWIGVSNLVTKQSVVLDLPVKACKTRDNVTVNIDMSLVFRIMGDEERGEDPQLVRNFVYAVKPRGLEEQLRDAQGEAMRGLARSLRHTEIYGIRSSQADVDSHAAVCENEALVYRDPVLEGESDTVDVDSALNARAVGYKMTEAMKAQLNSQFVPQGVLVESVMIKAITLPQDITKQMSDKTMVISQNAAQRMYHQNEMQNNRMEQQVETLLQTFSEQREQERATGEQQLNEEMVQLNSAKAEAKKSEANIREESSAKIETIKAESAMKVQRVVETMNADTTRMLVEAEKESAELHATTKLEAQTLLSQAEATAAQHAANAQKKISSAEGTIAPWISAKNIHLTELKKLQIYSNLAHNPDTIVYGNDDNTSNLLVLADALLENADHLNVRSRLMAELAVMGSASHDPTSLANDDKSKQDKPWF